jgi:large subunit ribosomal protein L15
VTSDKKGHIGLENLSAPLGSHRDRRRRGRGPGSGMGKTSGRGTKGIKARAGHHGPGGNKPHFEGGQMPLTRRVPKRGFTNPFREEAQVVSLADLARLPKGAEVTEETLITAGLVRKGRGPVKLLANGEIARPVTVRGIRTSASAREKVIAAGGRVEA